MARQAKSFGCQIARAESAHGQFGSLAQGESINREDALNTYFCTYCGHSFEREEGGPCPACGSELWMTSQLGDPEEWDLFEKEEQ